MQKYILTFKNQAKQLNFVLGFFYLYIYIYIGMTYHVIVQIITRGFWQRKAKVFEKCFQKFPQKILGNKLLLVLI